MRSMATDPDGTEARLLPPVEVQADVDDLLESKAMAMEPVVEDQREAS